MIITKTPLRVSFAGGGTDFREYYSSYGSGPGMVTAAAITPAVYVILKERYDKKLYVGYSQTEICLHADEVEHDLVRCCLVKAGIDHGIELKIMADVPGEGSGLGSSSSLTVGLLNALYHYQGRPAPARKLAEDACEIEIETLGQPIGKQDQYMAAFGGVATFTFWHSGSVDWHPHWANLPEHRRELSERLLLFDTGKTRRAETILTEQVARYPGNIGTLEAMEKQASELSEAFAGGHLQRVGPVIRAGWELKKTLASTITNYDLDRLIERALENGAAGAKITGGGGGGHLLVACDPEYRDDIRDGLADLQELPFAIARYGSRVIFQDGE